MLFHRDAIERHLQPLTERPIAHYTAISTLVHLMAVPPPPPYIGWTSARASAVRFLNDRAELLLGLETLRDVANQPPKSGRRVRLILESLLADGGRADTDAFLMSFSGDPDELGQWRGYASNGMGCSVVTAPRDVHAAVHVAGWIVYEPKKRHAFAYKVLGELRNQTDDNLIEQVLVTAASLMKHEGFKAEREFRAIVFPALSAVRYRAQGDRLVPYVDFLPGAASLPVDRIVLGPGWRLAMLSPSDRLRDHVIQGVRRLLDSAGLGATDITYSTLPYDPQ
ncbi:MAG: DUF2971 domain-containing protein [Armatimonadetes bacterium]|nr:DUF2971 domain-containing protein [Armatimonadota bacterium]